MNMWNLGIEKEKQVKQGEETYWQDIIKAQQ